MTYWLYDPRKLASSSTLIPYKQKNLDEFLNFLTFLCLLSYMYLYKTKQIQKHGGILAFCFVTILFLGIITGVPGKNNGKDNNLFSNYDNSLFID